MSGSWLAPRAKAKGKRQKAKGKNKEGAALSSLLPFAFCLLPFALSQRPPPLPKSPLSAFQEEQQQKNNWKTPKLMHAALGDPALRVDDVVRKRFGLVERVIAPAGVRGKPR